MRPLVRPILLPLLAILLAALTTWLLPTTSMAQQNSPQAIEAARAHRASKGAAPAATAEAAPAATRPATSKRPAARGSLKACLDKAGMNPLERDRCMRRVCEGRWGQGDCPATGGDFEWARVPNAGTPLGRCLKEAGNNPFTRERCAWRHCSDKWDTSAECRALKPKQGAGQNF